MLEPLSSLEPDGSAPKTRIKDADAGYQIWNTLRMADAISAFERGRIDAAYDNEKPLNDTLLQQNGQSWRVNVSWGFAPMVLEMAQAGYVDIINASEVLFECPTNYGQLTEKYELERVVAEETSNAIREWREFIPTYLQLTSTFIKHGVGFAQFRDEFDWRWDAVGLSDFKIPRKTKIGQDNIEVACYLKFYSASQLYEFIKDPETATALGYNVPAIKKAIMDSQNNSNTFTRWRNWEWEKIEIELRNNDYYWTYGTAQTQSIRVVHMVWREFSQDGLPPKYSYGMLVDDDKCEDWLYHRVNRFAKSEDAYVAFTYGVGTNSYYHGVRGQGYTIYPINGALNRAYCQALELATVGAGPIFQPDNESSMQAMQFTPMGPFSLLTPGITINPSALTPNISNSIMPIMGQLTQLLRERTSNANTQALLDTTKEQTATEVEAKLGSIAKMSIASLSLFYDPWETLFRQMVKRMKREDYAENEPGGEFVVGLRKRLLKRGERFLKAFYELDTERLTIKRAVGSGSEAARMLAFNKMMQVWPYMDDFGRQNALRDLISEYVGWKNANRYVTAPTEDARPVMDESIAELQNDAILSGGIATVKPNDNQLVHARIHGQPIAELSKHVQDAMTVDPMSVADLIPKLQQLMEHETQHVQRLSEDPLSVNQVGEFKKLLQNADGIVHNAGLRLTKLAEKQQAEQQDQQILQEGQPQQGGISPETVAEIEKQRALTAVKIEGIQATTQAKIAAKGLEARQKLAIKDAESAIYFQQKMRVNQ